MRLLTTLCILLAAAPAMAGGNSQLPIANSRRAGMVTDRQAERAIIGEAGGQGDATMTAVACALRNRIKAGLGLRGVFGSRNPVVRRASNSLWKRAAEAWRASALRDVTGGLMYFGGPADADYFLNELHFRAVKTVGKITFYRP